MKPFTHISLVPWIAVITLAATACGHKDSAGHAHGTGDIQTTPEVAAGATFNAKRGLFVPPATATFIGLQVADVEERHIAAAFHLMARVYRTASEVRVASLQPTGRPDALASGSVSPDHAAQLSEGQPVTAQRSAGGVSLQGRIVALKGDLAQANGQVEVLVAISDSQQPLAAGESLSVTIPTGGDEKVVAVPRSALFRTTEGDFVYTVSGDHFVRTPVTLGVVNQEFAEVTDGLYAGDQFVVQPVMTLWLAELQSLRGGKACADGH